MRIAISALAGMLLTAAAAGARAQEIMLTGPLCGDCEPTAGFKDGFFLSNGHGDLRLYPGALVQTDFMSFLGKGVASVPSTSGGTGLATRFFMRRARLSLGGEVFKSWTFRASIDFGGEATANGDGKAESSAAPGDVKPDATTARYAPVQSVSLNPSARDVWVNCRFSDWLNFQAGQFAVPFSMENRSHDAYLPWMEREVAIRSFVVPSNRDIGLMIWGDVGEGSLAYEIGVFGGEGQNRFTVDGRFDFVGRLYVRPLAHGATTIERTAQIGVSARRGARDPSAVGYDYPAITTGQGFILWKPTYTDSRGRLVHIIPSGFQDAIGGEATIHGSRVGLSGELYYVNNSTREAIDGFQLTHTERLGSFQGFGWYVQGSAWPVGDAFIYPDPGVNRPKTLDRSSGTGTIRRGLELLALVAGVNASYQGATRKDSVADPKTPGSDVTIYQIGLGAQYWHTKHVRASINYNAYTTPDSGDPKKNQALVPDNLQKDGEGKPLKGHWLHELGARISISF